MPLSRQIRSKSTSEGVRPNRFVKTFALSVNTSSGAPWLQGRTEVPAYLAGNGAGHDPGTRDEARVVVDAVKDLALGAVFKEDSADDVHLPELHRSAPLPTLVFREFLATGLLLNQTAAHQGSIDRRLRGQRSNPSFSS